MWRYGTGVLSRPSPADGTAHAAPAPQRAEGPAGERSSHSPGGQPQPLGAPAAVAGSTAVKFATKSPLFPPTPPGPAWGASPLDDNEEVEVEALADEVAAPALHCGVAPHNPPGRQPPKAVRKGTPRAPPHPLRLAHRAVEVWTARRGQVGGGRGVGGKREQQAPPNQPRGVLLRTSRTNARG